MKILIGLLILLLSLLAFATDDFKVDVNSLDQDVDPASLKSTGVKVHEGLPDAPVQHDKIPVARERDLIFKKAGMESDVKDLDDLDRDILFRKARALNHKEISASYPKISSDKLKLLQKMIHAK